MPAKKAYVLMYWQYDFIKMLGVYETLEAAQAACPAGPQILSDANDYNGDGVDDHWTLADWHEIWETNLNAR